MVVMKIDEKKVIEVIGRLQGRATSHLNAAEQTLDKKKAAAHLTAADDLFRLAEDLADATDDPEYAKSMKAYRWAVGQE